MCWTRHIGMSRSQHQLSHWTVTMIKWYENDYIWCLGSTNYFFDDFSWMNSTMWFLYLRNFSYVLFSLKWKSNCWVKSGFERLLISDLSQHWWFIKHIVLTTVSSTIKKCKILLFVFRQPTSFLGIRHKRNKLNHQNVNSEK